MEGRGFPDTQPRGSSRFSDTETPGGDRARRGTVERATSLPLGRVEGTLCFPRAFNPVFFLTGEGDGEETVSRSNSDLVISREIHVFSLDDLLLDEEDPLDADLLRFREFVFDFGFDPDFDLDSDRPRVDEDLLRRVRRTGEGLGDLAVDRDFRPRLR